MYTSVSQEYFKTPNSVNDHSSLSSDVIASAFDDVALDLMCLIYNGAYFMFNCVCGCVGVCTCFICAQEPYVLP